LLQQLKVQQQLLAELQQALQEGQQAAVQQAADKARQAGAGSHDCASKCVACSFSFLQIAMCCWWENEVHIPATLHVAMLGLGSSAIIDGVLCGFCLYAVQAVVNR
jgi:hypothetical protein